MSFNQLLIYLFIYHDDDGKACSEESKENTWRKRRKLWNAVD